MTSLVKKVQSGSGRADRKPGGAVVSGSKRAAVRGTAIQPKSSVGTSSATSARRGSKAGRVQSKAGMVLDTQQLLQLVQSRVDLTPAIARALKTDFKKMLDAQLKPAARAEPVVDDVVLTTQEAAELVGVSRPYLVARIEAGEIPLHQQVGNQRRVLKSAVLAWQLGTRQRQRRALSELGADLDDEVFGADRAK